MRAGRQARAERDRLWAGADRGSAGQGGSRVFCDSPENLLASFHTVKGVSVPLAGPRPTPLGNRYAAFPLITIP